MPTFRSRPSRPPATSRNDSSSTTIATTTTRNKRIVIIPDEPAETDLRVRICQIFAGASKSAAAHRKSCISLRHIQEACCYETADQQSRYVGDANDFNTEIWRCLVRVFSVKRGEGAGDRVIRFLGAFLIHGEEKDNQDQELGLETPTSTLTSLIIERVTPLMQAKDKIVRYRATQTVAEIINSITSIDDDAFDLSRMGLLRAMRDKESYIRVQAVVGLGKLVGDGSDADNMDGGDADDTTYGDPDTAAGLLPKLLDLLQNDPSSDVRKTLLMNLPVSQASLPYLLERARDQDGPTRRALYGRLLPRIGDFRHLTLAMREKLLRWGLRDRDAQVRVATERLFYEQWIGDCRGAPNADESAEDSQARDMTALLELLERIGIAYSGTEGGVALEAMDAFWTNRLDYQTRIAFSDAYFDALTPESAFLLRSLSDFCHQQAAADNSEKMITLLEEKLPEVTRFAFHLGHYTNILVDSLRILEARQRDQDATPNQSSTEQDEEQEELALEQEFVVEQLLHMAARLDFSDEIGRRKMFALLREMLVIPELPTNIRKLIVEDLKMTMAQHAAGERDFCGVIVEAIAEINDTIVPASAENEPEDEDADESFHSAQSDLSSSAAAASSHPPKPAKTFLDQSDVDPLLKLQTNLKCLAITQTALTLVQNPLQSNPYLQTLRDNLIVPAVRSYDAPLREQGLTCLGLCCLLDLQLARENLGLFQHCYLKGNEALQTKSLEVMADMLITWRHKLFTLPDLTSPQKQQDTTNAGPSERDILKLYAKALRSTEKPTLQAAASTSMAKLLLAQVIPTSKPLTSSTSEATKNDALTSLLHLLLKTYFLPSTPSNPALLQSLAYLLPVYAHSSAANQLLLSSVCIPVLKSLFILREERALDAGAAESDDDAGAGAERSEGEMVGPSIMGGVIAEWCDGRRVYDPHSPSAGEAGNGNAGCDAHLQLARDALEKLGSVSGGPSKDERKMWASLLGKLHFCPPARFGSAQAGLTPAMVELGISGPSGSGVTMNGEERVAAVERYGEVLESFRSVVDERISGGAVDTASRNAVIRAMGALEKVTRKMEELIGASEDGAGDVTLISTSRGSRAAGKRQTNVTSDEGATVDLTTVVEDVTEVNQTALEQDETVVDATEM